MADKSATLPELQALHKKVAAHLIKRLDVPEGEEFMLDAATLGVAVKFLKDNNVSADPADKDDLDELRDKMAENARKRRENRGKVVQLSGEDYKVMEG